MTVKQNKTEAVAVLAAPPEIIDFTRFACTKCELYKTKKHFVLPSGNINGRILLIGESPGADEDLAGKQFVGKSGQLLREALLAAGFDLNELYITNAIMCRVPVNRKPKKEEILACNSYASHVISSMPNLKLIIVLGALALESILKMKQIMSKHGTIIKKNGHEYMPILHPAAILRDPNKREMFMRDFVFAKHYLEDTVKTGTYTCCDTLELANTALDTIQDVQDMAFDLETSAIDDDFPNPFVDEIAGVSFTTEEYKGYYIPFITSNTPVFNPTEKALLVARLKTILEDPRKRLVMHNGKFDSNFLKTNFNIDVTKFYEHPDGLFRSNFYFDTILAHHLLWQAPPHGLKFLSRRFPDLAYYESALQDYKKDNKIKNYAMIPKEIMYKYAAADADATWRLYQIYKKELQTYQPTKFMGPEKTNHMTLETLMFQHQMPLANILGKAEYRGIKVDPEVLNSLGTSLDAQMVTLQTEIYELAGEEFNIGSSQQKAKILYEKLKLPVLKRTGEKKAPSTDKETLAQLDHPVAKKMVEFAHVSKMRSTYVTSLLEKMDSNNVIHTSYKEIGTETGRLSSIGPNLQNTPAKVEFRNIFLARPGYSYVGSDFSQIELRVLAYYSRDPKMLQAFFKGEDIHSLVAHECFGIPADQKEDKQTRRICKAINFGICYGIQAVALSKQIDKSEDEAQAYINMYLNRFRGVFLFQEQIKKFLHTYGYITNYFGRYHHIPSVNASDRTIVGEAERTALNSPIQGTAAELTNTSAVQCALAFEKAGLDAHLILTVHDELVYEVRNDQLIQAAEIVYKIMRGIAEYWLGIPVPVDQYINGRWVEFDAYAESLGKTEKDGVLYQARYLHKCGYKLRDLLEIPRKYVSAVPKNSIQEVAGSR